MKIYLQLNQVMIMFSVIDISKLHTCIVDSIDVFLTFCSFEGRCTSISNNLPLAQVKEKIILCNKEMSQETRNNLSKLKDVLGSVVRIEEVDLFQPLMLADKIIEIFRKSCRDEDQKHILIDITSFTHEALLILIAISRLFPNILFDFAYVNAMEYASESEDNGDKKWLSRGIREVRSVLGYAGDIKPSQKTVLIMMAGYECERAWRLIDSISPEELIITYNNDSGATDQKHGDASKLHADLLKDLAAYYQNPKSFIISSNNPFETERGLQGVIDSIEKDKNIIIAPMNNKLSTVGAALVAFKRPDIQLCYAPAVVYNTSSYSVGGNKCFLFSLEERNKIIKNH